MRTTLAVMTTFVFILCLFTPEGPISDSYAANEATDISSQFIGSWALVSFTDIDEQGKTIVRYGENAFGRISYGANGKMMVVLMAYGRETTNDPDFFSYTGGYDIDEVAGTVTHHIEACIAPDWLGTDRVRNFEFLDANRIALRPQEGTSELIWRREN